MVSAQQTRTTRAARAPAEFGRVAVLYGGDSAEREISLQSGTAVIGALRNKGLDVVPIDKGADVLDHIRAAGVDRVFIILHGRGGEDGSVQGALDTVGIAYTGSGVLGSALAMDKHRAKRVWQACGIPTPEFRVVRSEDELLAAGRALGFPLAVKPVHEGSSIGVCCARDEEGLHVGWYEAMRYDDELIVEPWLRGEEYTAAILGEEVLPLIRLEPARDFYDYSAKYADDAGTRYHCPSGLEPGARRVVQGLEHAGFPVRGGERLGKGRLPVRPERRSLLPGRQHRPRDDRPQPRADGRAGRRHRFRRAGVADSRDHSLGPHRDETCSDRLRRCPPPGRGGRARAPGAVAAAASVGSGERTFRARVEAGSRRGDRSLHPSRLLHGRRVCDSKGRTHHSVGGGRFGAPGLAGSARH